MSCGGQRLDWCTDKSVLYKTKKLKIKSKPRDSELKNME